MQPRARDSSLDVSSCCLASVSQITEFWSGPSAQFLASRSIATIWLSTSKRMVVASWSATLSILACW